MKFKPLPKFITDPDPSIYFDDDYLVVDFETNNKDRGSALVPENNIVLSVYEDAEQFNYKFGGIYQQQKLVERAQQAKFFVAHNCFTGDTQFITAEGNKTLQGAAGSVQTVWTEYGWADADIRHYGKAKVFELSVSPYNRSRTSISHTIRATANHKWLVDRVFATNRYGRTRKRVPGYLTTAELRKGDKILAEAPRIIPSETSEAFKHGLIFADGTLRKADSTATKFVHQIRLCGEKAKWAHLFSVTYPPSADGDPVCNYYVTGTNYKELPKYTCPQDVADFIHGWEVMDGTAPSNGAEFTRLVQTADPAAADWLQEHAALAGWLVTGRSSYMHDTGSSYKTTLMHTVVLSKDQDMGWTVQGKFPIEGEVDVYCADVRGFDRFTLAGGIYTGNSKFELQWLQRAGLDLSQVLVFDTMIAEYVLAGNRIWKLDLDSVAERRGLGNKNQLVSKLIKLGVDPADIHPEWLLEYCVQDVSITGEIFKQQLIELRDKGLLEVFYARCLTTPALADIEKNGMCLDESQVIPEYNRLAYANSDILRKLDEMTGGINPRSTKQVAAFLYDVLGFPEPKIRGEAVRSTAANVIAGLKAMNKRQKQFLALKKEQAKINAALTKTITPFYKCIEDSKAEKRSPILFGNFNQCRTQTHRLSSSGKKYKVQFQNFPRIYKALLKARYADWLVGEADSGQLEFRVAVLLAQDEQGFRDIADGVDVHVYTASIIYQEKFEQVCKELGRTDVDRGEGNKLFKKHPIGAKIRQDSKVNTFKPLYGGRSGTEREQAYYKFFGERYKQITDMQNKWIDTVLSTKQLTTATGLIFYWPTTKMSKSGYVENTTAICNYPVQMFATADIMPIAVRILWQYMQMYKMQSFLTNTVHDSAISEVHPDEQELYKQLAEQAFNVDSVNFITKLYDFNFNLPLEAEIKLGKNWGA